MIFWKFVVTERTERIRIVRGENTIFEGTVPHPWPASLTIGDAVYAKRKGGHWRKKFEVTMRRGRPSIRFGTHYGPKQQFRNLFLKEDR